MQFRERRMALTEKMERDSLISPETRADDPPTSANEKQARAPLDGIKMPTANESGHDLPRLRLRSSSYVLALVALYMALALFSWVITCILTVRPITTASYGVRFFPGGLGSYPSYLASENHALYVRNEKWLQAAQVVQSIVAVFTIPLASTVCSKAAVIFVQQQGQRELSLRQTIALADRGWTDPVIYVRLVSGGFKQYGSKLLVLAILLNVLGTPLLSVSVQKASKVLTTLGGIITPLRSVFMTTKTIKTPTHYLLAKDLADIPKKVGGSWPDEDRELIVEVRSALAAASNTSPRSRLWTGKPLDCLASLAQPVQESLLPTACDFPSVGLANMSLLPDPFVAELPSGYSTGLIRQYLPRINSTARWEAISAPGFPHGCDAIPGSFYVKYAAAMTVTTRRPDLESWSLEACMPADLTRSPWRAVRSRQDFTEELYINVSMTGLDYEEPEEKGGMFRISLDTTAGYFELPNYTNGEQPGPLLDHDPMSLCRDNCRDQLTRLRTEWDSIEHSRPDMPLAMQPNRGPLSAIALALFGNGSFFADRVARPEAFIYPNFTIEDKEWERSCVELAPFLRLLRGDSDRNLATIDRCVRNDVHNYNDIQEQVRLYLRLLYWNNEDAYEGERITNAFTSAAFLANEVWLTRLRLSGSLSLTVARDHGADTLVPVISRAGIVVVSTFLGLFLAALLGLAAYSARAPRWTEQLDAFAMLRVGASIAGAVPFRPAPDDRRVRALDDLPGWVGDATGGRGELGALALGGEGKLDGKRKFATYGVEAGGKEEDGSRER